MEIERKIMETKTRKTTKTSRNNIGTQCDSKTTLREGFTAEEREELRYAVSITDYIREKGITI